MALFFSSCGIAYILIVWFHTNAISEYSKLLKVDCFCNPLKQFNLIKDTIPGTLFVDFIKEHYDSFFSRLLTCEVCLSFWISILVGLDGVFSRAGLSLLIYYALIKIRGK